MSIAAAAPASGVMKRFREVCPATVKDIIPAPGPVRAVARARSTAAGSTSQDRIAGDAQGHLFRRPGVDEPLHGVGLGAVSNGAVSLGKARVRCQGWLRLRR